MKEKLEDPRIIEGTSYSPNLQQQHICSPRIEASAKIKSQLSHVRSLTVPRDLVRDSDEIQPIYIVKQGMN